MLYLYLYSLCIVLCVIYCVTNKKKKTLKVLVATIDAQWEGMGDVGSARYELALLPLSPTIRFLSYSIVNFQKFSTLRVNTCTLSCQFIRDIRTHFVSCWPEMS